MSDASSPGDEVFVVLAGDVLYASRSTRAAAELVAREQRELAERFRSAGARRAARLPVA